MDFVKKSYLNKIKPAQIIALGFMLVIFIGAILLMLPISANEGVKVTFIDALFTSTSAVCVTGLIAIDTADTFSVFGCTIVALLIQIGGLGVTSLGVGVIMIVGRRVGFKQRTLIKEAWNLSSFKGIVKLVRAVLIMTLCFELVGAILSFIVFRQDYDTLHAIGISAFHSVAAFNNSGFDVLGGLQNLIPYYDNVLLNLTTCGLIIFGGIGFLVIMDIIKSRSFKKLTLHSKVVISTSAVLLIVGTLLIKFTDDISWMAAFFHSTSARTAGFSTYPIGNLSNAGLLVITILMFIGASPGSTGGGIKTSTMFVLIQAVKSMVTNQHCEAFKRLIPYDVIVKSFIIFVLSIALVLIGTFIMCILEPEYSLMQNLFEITSAFGTVGLSTGITPDLGEKSKLLLVLMMYIGRLGPLTIATLWFDKERSSIHFSEEMITIG